MKLLFKYAFKHSKHLWLFAFTITAMFVLTIANQLEILSFGVIAQKGPELFEVFGPIKNGVLQDTHTITKEEFDKRWKEIAKDHPEEISKGDIQQFVSTMKPKGIIEQVIHHVDRYVPLNDVKNLAIMVALIGLLKAISMFCDRYFTKLIAIRISRDLRQDYFDHLQKLPMSFYQKHNIGDLSSRVIGDAYAIAEGMNAFLNNYVQAPFTILSTLFLCFMTSWQLSMITFFGAPFVVLPIIFIAKKYKKISRKFQKNQEGFASVLIEFISGVQTVKVFAMEKFSNKKYLDRNNQMSRLEQKTAKYDLASRPIIHSIAMFFLSFTLIYGLYFLHMNTSDVFIYCALLYLFYEPIKKFAEDNNLLLWGVAACERLDEVLSLQPQIKDEEGAKTLTQFNHSIEFKDVWFRYKDDWVLKGVNFTIKKGETVAIVGPTGAGKSTIVLLLPRLYEVEKGDILIDGVSIKDLTQKSLRENIAFVPQRPFLFYDTVAENISFGRGGTHVDIVKAAKMAHADEFIQHLPQKYETHLAEAGKDLSGGQQQRLAIARALLKKSPILVMDEATSSLDAISENHIKQAIQKLHGTVTQVIIAHRLSTIENADKIIYLESGVNVAEGTKDELLEKCGAFKEMWEMMHKTKRDEKTELLV